MSYDSMARLTLDEVKRMVEEMKSEQTSKDSSLDYIAFSDDEETQEDEALSDEEIRIRQVMDISNQDELMEIVYGDESYEVKYEALKNICDENLDEISGNIGDEIIIELIDDITFDRGFRRRNISGLS